MTSTRAPTPRLYAAYAERIATVRKRFAQVTGLGEILWVIALLLFLVDAAFLPSFTLQADAMTPYVDLPPELAAVLKARGVHLMSGYAPGMSNSMPAMALLTFTSLLFGTAAMAASRGRWWLYTAACVLMLTPPEIFGSAFHSPVVGGATTVTIIAGICLMIRKQYKGILYVGLACVVIWGWHDLCGIYDRSRPTVRAPSATEDSAIAAFRPVERVLDAAAPRYPQAVTYVRAQIAYSRHDWPRLSALGPLPQTGFGTSVFTAARLSALAQAQASLANPHQALRTPMTVIRTWLMLGIGGLSILLAAVADHVRRRLKRLDRLAADMGGLQARPQG